MRKLEEYLIESLNDPKEAKAFLNAALEEFQEDNDFQAFGNTIELLIKSQGSMSNFAKETDINRTHLYRIINNEVQPQFSTVSNILKSLGFKLSIKKVGKLKPA